MAHSDSEDEVEESGELDFDGRSSDADEINDEDLFDVEENADEGTERDEETGSDVDEDAEDDEDDDDDDEGNIPLSQQVTQTSVTSFPVPPLVPPSIPPPPAPPTSAPAPEPMAIDIPQRDVTMSNQRERSMSPAHLRRKNILQSVTMPRSYTVEAICAIPHPTPTHALASSLCMTHLITGSEDGYIRDYDVFAGANGKTLLTAPQRAHCAVVEGTMKASVIRYWWENPKAGAEDEVIEDEDTRRSSVTSLAMHSDALWALAGSEQGHVNLFTVRHEPGQFITSMNGHRGPVSSLALQHDEMGFFSAGWDGDVLQWDLNTGQQARKFHSHRAQVAIVAVRPLGPVFPPPPVVNTGKNNSNDVEMRSEASFDSLFGDDPNGDGENAQKPSSLQIPSRQGGGSRELKSPGTAIPGSAGSRSGPPTLTSDAYGSFSPDVLMTASVDGSVVLWDRRVNSPGMGVGRLETSSKTPPWCVSACWSADGGQVYAGRRNCTVDVWDTRMFSSPVNGVPRLLRTLRNPISSGAVSCVASFPDGRHIAVASSDNVRLWNASEATESDPSGRSRSGVPYKIIPGHHGGIVSQMIVDPAARFMVSASSNRGWSGESTRTVLIHDIKYVV